jgi:hypothetical protein
MFDQVQCAEQQLRVLARQMTHVVKRSAGKNDQHRCGAESPLVTDSAYRGSRCNSRVGERVQISLNGAANSRWNSGRSGRTVLRIRPVVLRWVFDTPG